MRKRIDRMECWVCCSDSVLWAMSDAEESVPTGGELTRFSGCRVRPDWLSVSLVADRDVLA